MAIGVDTIFAVASGQPPAAIAMMRISGPSAFVTATEIVGKLPPPRVAALRALRDPATGELLDRGIVLAFPGPATATGEDIVELHLHGGRAVIAAVSECLGRQPGLRRAEPGEFTRRALISGRIDLAEAEGLGELLTAQTEAQRRAAIASVEGAVSQAVRGWAERLLDVSAQVEAALDFSDEGDVAESSAHTVHRAVAALRTDLADVLAVPPVERLHHGISIVLAGPPNSGKSSLLNALAQRDVSIVSPIAGTTRDRLEAAVVRGGVVYLLTDTAGLADSTDDPIEAIGIDRARQSLVLADIILWLGDTVPADWANTLWLWPKADVAERRFSVPEGRFPISAVSGIGIEALWDAIANTARTLLPRDDQLALNARQRGLCIDCLDALEPIAEHSDLLIIAEQLRLARRALDKITGATDVEAMLDTLFGQFCIGK